MLKSIFFKPLVLAIRSVKELASFLSEMWNVFFRIGSRRLSMPRPLSSLIHA